MATTVDSRVSFDDIVAAAERLSGVAHRTPVVTSRTLDARVGARVFLKCENLQRGGAFKFRGAHNAISRLSDGERARGILAYSSGNHAQAVALSSRLFGVPATVVMPRNAPPAKRKATEGYGARVVDYDPAVDKREEIAARLQAETNPVLIPPFDHPDVIAGQGTAAKELFEDAGPLDLLLVPCGGGGLLSGSALSARRLGTGCRVVGVEPALGDDATRSFHSGTLQTVHNPLTIADGARTPSLSPLTFRLIRENVDDMVTATDDELIEAVLFVLERLRLVAEPTGALGLAALLSGRVGRSARRIGVLISGGNIDLSMVSEWGRARDERESSSEKQKNLT
jgi:threonine dehydratase